MKRWIVVALVACGCPSKPPAAIPEGTTGGGGATAGDGTTAGGGSASHVTPAGAACDAMRTKVERLYRAETRERDPVRFAEAVADNTTMVMNDCRTAPDKATACIAAATTVKELEARCLVPIDDEGTEGDSAAR